MENQQFLKVGDRIKLENGMMVYTEAPQKFFYENCKFSNKLDLVRVEIGFTYTNPTNIQSDIEAITRKIVNAFLYRGAYVNENDAIEFVFKNIKQPVQESFCVPEGVFVVTKAAYEGGGKMNRYDAYADGYKVWAQDVNSDRVVSFYQSGDFDTMITDIKPL